MFPIITNNSKTGCNQHFVGETVCVCKCVCERERERKRVRERERDGEIVCLRS